MHRWFFGLVIYISCFDDGSSTCAFNNRSFPDNFLFGVGTSAYQVEGGWDADGKGENIWDHALHTRTNITADGQNADVACDFYHKYKEDILILKDLGVNTLRVSISWSRILPQGTIDVINWPGISYYRSVLTELLSHGIEPMVTLFHWDLPQPLQERGGFLNEELVQWFADYANLLFKHLGDLVKYWFTFNESMSICTFGYGMKIFAPFYNGDGVYDYICASILLKAHAKAYHIYDEQYRYYQNGLVSIVLLSNWHSPGSSDPADIEAAERSAAFVLGLYANPIFNYNWPEAVESRVAYRSELEGRCDSRLPKFTDQEIQYIHGTADFFSLNHYSSFLIFNTEESPASAGPGFYIDVGVNMTYNPSWPSTCSTDIKIVPLGMTNILAEIKRKYNNPRILITENGACDFGGLDDKVRVVYTMGHLSAMLDAMEKYEVRAMGYTAWSFADSFEWGSGYKVKFGFYHVDFNDPNLPRTPKSSAVAYKQIIGTRCLCDECVSPSSY